MSDTVEKISSRLRAKANEIAEAAGLLSEQSSPFEARLINVIHIFGQKVLQVEVAGADGSHADWAFQSF
jgi:hypothetical protein